MVLSKAGIVGADLWDLSRY